VVTEGIEMKTTLEQRASGDAARDPDAAAPGTDGLQRSKTLGGYARDTQSTPGMQFLKAANEQLVLKSLHAQELAESTEAFRLFVDTVKEYAIFMLDRDGHVKSWNSGAERIQGYEASEIVGKHFSVFYPAEDVKAGKCERHLEMAARDGRIEEEGQRVRRDGSTFVASVVITALRDADGRVIGFGEVTRDLTDRVRMEEDRLEFARIEEAERTKDQFLAIMGHELRNPLAPMVAAVHLLKLEGDQSTRRELIILDRQLQHMKRLVDDLLDVSRARRDVIQLVRKRMEISEVLANAVDVAAPLILARRHRLVLDIPATGLVVDVDPARGAQIFGNVLNNAAKYTEPGGQIFVRASVDDDYVRVTIDDTGMGIAPELKPRLFDLFTQGAQGSERHMGGLGIGLAIASRLVSAHGGDIAAESDGPGHGSRFTVRLPRIDAAAAEHSEPPPSRARAPFRRRVLIVDDNEDAAEMVQAYLQRRGHETRIAFDGPSALEIAKSTTPDVVVLDIGLPGMDGFEVVRRMRQIPACSTIPIVALSGYASSEDCRKAFEAGFTVHFAKPVDFSVLERAVETIAGVPSLSL
jgi:PAS domain S-box-containing protein